MTFSFLLMKPNPDYPHFDDEPYLGYSECVMFFKPSLEDHQFLVVKDGKWYWWQNKKN